jgi:MinD-like ATPase involved in chromosome partitioning or flagellar assembly
LLRAAHGRSDELNMGIRVAVAGIGGGAGVSTLSALLCATWPNDRLIGVEADPDGGVWAARFGLSGLDDAPGVASMIASFRSFGDDPEGALAHTQLLWDGPRVACVSTTPSVARRIVKVLVDVWDDLTSLLPEDADLIVDVGRWRSDGSSAALFGRSDAAIVVVRPYLEWLEHLAREAPLLLAKGPVGVVVRGDGPYSPSDVVRFVEQASEAAGRPGDLSVIGTLAEDTKALAIMTRGGKTSTLRRSSLIKSAQSISNAIAAQRQWARPLTVPDVLGEVIP